MNKFEYAQDMFEPYTEEKQEQLATPRRSLYGTYIDLLQKADQESRISSSGRRYF